MDQISALRDTVFLARRAPWKTSHAAATVEYLEDMLNRIIADQCLEPKHRQYSKSKIGRHLGWAQAVVYLNSPMDLNLDTFMEINKRHADKK